ncbi:hypothetical protein M422DRAFT_250032 [Sphaerobolus stellatus SS14]|nr:hypothetical protein M422DRAFT_250032 [Sphaerobolus stellatus SS14]
MSYHATDPSHNRDAPFTFQETGQMPFIGSEEPRQHLPHDQPFTHDFTNGSNLTQYYTGDSDDHYSAYNDQIVLEHSTDEANNAHLISQYSSQALFPTQPLDRTASFGAPLVPHGTPLPIRPDPSQLQQPHFRQLYVDFNVTRELDSNQYGSQSAVSNQQLIIIANGAIGSSGRTYLALPSISTSTPFIASTQEWISSSALMLGSSSEPRNVDGSGPALQQTHSDSKPVSCKFVSVNWDANGLRVGAFCYSCDCGLRTTESRKINEHIYYGGDLRLFICHNW